LFDGFGVGGYVPREVAMTIRFLASAPPPVTFENWIAYMDQTGEVAYASALLRCHPHPSAGNTAPHKAC